MAAQRPIGYWLKELDRRIDARFEDDLAASGLTRRHWQILHSLAEGPRSASDVRDGLAPFWKDPSEWGVQLAQLVARGDITDDSGTLALTEAGHTTHHQAFTLIGKRRRAMLDGITDDQYVETVRLLERMAENMAGA
ncbi:MarR family winged helix-turn-helix transcriptional regulator [Nocardia sp. NPDC050630]|uniref:MarR family winged helix-turn-helix transcriptional regulator n=1 Tax=Nocardia sp. NPDC050630 TaxID=3364321 RepID=UPI0037B7784B